MKLIIDIPDEKYERIIKDAQARMYHTNDLFELVDMLKNATPLDDVKAEIEDQKTRRLLQDEDLHWYREGLKDSLEILDNIGKTESEDT